MGGGGGGEWLGAYPSSVCGTLLTDEEIRIAAGLRIGAPIVSPHLCVNCGAAVTASGTHGLSCLKSRGRFPRHENLKEIIGRALRSAGLPTRLEPLGLCCGTDNRRPDSRGSRSPSTSLVSTRSPRHGNIVSPALHWSRRKPKKERSTPISGATFSLRLRWRRWAGGARSRSLF